LSSPHRYLGCPDFISCHSQIPNARSRARHHPCGPATGDGSVSLRLKPCSHTLISGAGKIARLHDRQARPARPSAEANSRFPP
jgi:hypothetical protein